MFPFPEGYKKIIIIRTWLIINYFLSMYLQFTIHCYTIKQIYTQLCVNNIEVTVNTCTGTDVFTVITIKDQSGGISNPSLTLQCIVDTQLEQYTCTYVLSFVYMYRF